MHRVRPFIRLAGALAAAALVLALFPADLGAQALPPAPCRRTGRLVCA